MGFHGCVHDPESVLLPWLEDCLEPGSAIAVGICSVDESVLEDSRQSGRLHGLPLREHGLVSPVPERN